MPFVDGGRTLYGMDCWGLAMETMRRYGHEVPDFHASCFDATTIHSIYTREKKHRWVRAAYPAPGDLAVMTLDPRHPELIQHVGVYIGGGRVLHTLDRRESHLIRMDDPFWSKKVRGFYRWTG